MTKENGDITLRNLYWLQYVVLVEIKNTYPGVLHLYVAITLDVVHILLAVEQLLLPKAMRRLLSAVSQQQDRYLIDTGVRVTHM